MKDSFFEGSFICLALSMSKLEELRKEYKKITKKLSNPEDISDSQRFGKLSKRRDQLNTIIEKDKKYQQVKKEIKENKEIIDSGEEELAQLAEEELEELENKKKQLRKELKSLIIKQEEHKKQEEEGMSSNSVIMEIRSGAGGDEACLFAGDLFDMYSKYVKDQGWQLKILDSTQAEIGGYKSITFKVKGEEVYSELRFEGGVHRVQRIPETEKSDRIHTSTVTVAVLPEPDKPESIELDQNNLRVDTYRASGPGGQYVNTKDTAVRITHKPTDIVVASQNERSQHQNKENAMSILKAKILEKKRKEKQKKVEEKRQSQIAGAKRSQKIRTYNFLQDRITDHRVEENWHNLEEVLDGDLTNITKTLQKAEEKEKYSQIKLD